MSKAQHTEVALELLEALSSIVSLIDAEDSTLAVMFGEMYEAEIRHARAVIDMAREK